MELRIREVDEGGGGPFDKLRDRDFCTDSELAKLAFKLKSLNFSLCARSKVANGVVAVGLPHRNYSVLKQTHINQW